MPFEFFGQAHFPRSENTADSASQSSVRPCGNSAAGYPLAVYAFHPRVSSSAQMAQSRLQKRVFPAHVSNDARENKHLAYSPAARGLTLLCSFSFSARAPLAEAGTIANGTRAKATSSAAGSSTFTCIQYRPGGNFDRGISVK